MTTMPTWNGNGIIPPINFANPTSAERSPYGVSLLDFVLRFSLTPERCKILKGFLDYRAALHAIGIVEGFQWLNGSFLENIELTESRAPNDIDVVTMLKMPSGKTQHQILNLNPSLFPMSKVGKDALKAAFFVDANYIDLETQPETILERGTYWYSMWSHRRDYTWKGFAQVDLNPKDDSDALQALLQSSHMQVAA